MLSNLTKLARQALLVRRAVLRLPETVGRAGQYGDGPAGRHVVAVGDSVAAGVGVAHGQDTVAGQVAHRLAIPGATWAIHARSGLTARGVVALLDRPGVPEDVAEADVLVLSVGVNDLTALHPLRRWRTDLEALLRRLAVVAPRAAVVLLGMPPVETFPALPRPLRDVLATRAERMDRVGVDTARRHGVLHLPLDAELLEVADAFAADGFHPSARAHARLAEAVVALLDETERGIADVG